jgi:ketosteroid isomerase-like protein
MGAVALAARSPERDTARAMSQENVEIVRATYDEWKLGNLAAAVKLFDPEIVFESFMPDSSERIVAHGPKEVEAFTRELLAQTREYRMVGEEFRAVGEDKVFVAGRQSHHRPTERSRGRQPGLLGVDISRGQARAVALRDR